MIFLYMFRALGAHLQEGTIVYMQHMVLSLSMRKSLWWPVGVPTGHHELSYRVTVPYAACIQLYPPEDEHLMLETCRGEQYFMNK
jgi:hypothetical protein